MFTFLGRSTSNYIIIKHCGIFIIFKRNKNIKMIGSFMLINNFINRVLQTYVTNLKSI